MRLDSEPWFFTYLSTVDRRYCKQMEQLICWFWPPHEHRRALWMAFHRSGFIRRHYPDEVRPGYGLFGLPLDAVPFTAADPERALDPIINVSAAMKLWELGGWSAINDGLEPTWPPGM